RIRRGFREYAGGVRLLGPQIVESLVDRGADLRKGNPLAYALCQRIQTALRILKRYRGQFPDLQSQADIALRHHCKEGNLKWVSLLLWAGADPYSRGPDNYDEEPDSDCHSISAVGYAALYEHDEVFRLKQIRLDPAHPAAKEVARWLCRGQ